MFASRVARTAFVGLAAMALIALVLTVPSVQGAEAPVTVVDPSTDAAICRIDLGTTGDMTDDGFYLSMDGDDDMVEVNDLRLNSVAGKLAGSILAAGDTTELVAADCQAYSVAFYDLHPNGRFGPGAIGNDTMYIGYDKVTTTAVQTATTTGDWWIRLVAYGTGATRREAGTLVQSGDQDANSFQGGTLLTGAEFAYWDKDATSTFTNGDLGYVTSRAVVSTDYVPLYSVRITRTLYNFGTYANVGDQDVTLPLVDPATDATICRVDIGNPNNAGDDAFYLNVNADGNTIQNGDVRLTPFADKPAGTIITGGSSSELVSTGVDCRAYSVAFYDNGNGIYDKDDAVLIGYDAVTTTLVSGTAHGSDWWIRVTPSKTYAAGTILGAGDSDFAASQQGSVLTGAEFAYYDVDQSTTTTFGDFVYLTAAAITTGNKAPVYSVRLSHPTYAYGTKVLDGDHDGPYVTPTPTPTTTTTKTTAITTSATSTTTTTTTTTSASPTISSLPAKTRVPGFEIAALVVAVSVLVLLRRKA